MIYVDKDKIEIKGCLIDLAAEINVLCERIKEILVKNEMTEEEAEQEIVAIVKLSFVPIESLEEATRHAPQKSKLTFANVLNYIEYLNARKKEQEAFMKACFGNGSGKEKEDDKHD